MEIKKILGNNLIHFLSRNIDQKILVIESDDWGSLRTESKEQRRALNRIDVNYSKDAYTQLDGLANADDLMALFETLNGVKDSQGNSCVVTANVCTANPDFNKIRSSAYQEFYYEPFSETIKRQNNGKVIWELWRTGIENKIFIPQLHGREHLHALAWLEELRLGNKKLKAAYELESWGISYKALKLQRRSNLQAALDRYGLKGENEFQRDWVKDSANIFIEAFGYRATSFIAPAYIWPLDIHPDLEKCGIVALQGIKLQYIPKNSGYIKKPRILGLNIGKSDLLFLPRNVFFEPANQPNKDWYSEVMNGVIRAFRNKQPAIIGSHRLNFIGKLDEKNRARNLATLKAILKKVTELYPDVKFISSDQLVNYYRNKQ